MQLLLLVLGLLCSVLQAQEVLVTEKQIGIVGKEVIMPCKLNSKDPSVRVTQIMWMNSSGRLAAYSPHIGTHSTDPTRFTLINSTEQTSATLIISPVLTTDQGEYWCEVTTFPGGTVKAATTLIVKAIPQNSAEANHGVVAGDHEQAVATCKSANSRPPSKITWHAAIPGNVSNTMINNTDGTYTIVSQYVTIPEWTTDGKSLTCIINYDSTDYTIPLTLSVQYPPVVTIEDFDDNWHLHRNGVYLTCNGKGNPPPTSYIWKTADGSPLPASVSAKNNVLYVDEVDERVNRSFLCEVTNALGSRESRQDVIVREHAVQTQTNAGAIAGGVIGGILVLLLLAAIIFIVIKRGNLQNKKDRGTYNPKQRTFGSGKPSEQFTYQDDGELDKPLKGPVPMRDSGLSPSLGDEDDDDEEERMKYKVLEDDEEEERFNEVGPMLQLRPHHPIDSYLDDDMESQTDGSIISRTAVYV
ncbi:nectin-2 isoform 1-T1 [Leptodactylus fuscus]|uniref:nectin-2 isoform X1 n=1 Tax=Leptodactylus fuscus TaxID=238119 RepID=UPI003F4E8A46